MKLMLSFSGSCHWLLSGSCHWLGLLHIKWFPIAGLLKSCLRFCNTIFLIFRLLAHCPISPYWSVNRSFLVGLPPNFYSNKFGLFSNIEQANNSSTAKITHSH